MFRHYLHLAWLNFRRHPTASFINVITLALGLICFILAWGITLFWEGAEGHFDNAERTFVISSEWRLADGSGSSGVSLPLTPHSLGAYLQTDFPQIEAAARAILLSDTTSIRAGERTEIMRVVAVDGPFLDIFNLPFINGNSLTALDTPRSIVLTRDAAQTLYGSTDVVGEAVTLYDNIGATVTGVIDRIPDPSHIGNSAAAPLQFDFLASRDVYEALIRTLTGGRDTTQFPEDWFSAQNTTYVMLPRNGSFSADQLRSELPDFVNRRVPELQRQRADFSLDVVPVDDLLAMAVRNTLSPQQNSVSVPLLLLILGVIVLLVACINFANLATARAASRAKEVGIRKAVGAFPSQIIVQHLFEAAMLTAVAVVIAVVSANSLIPIVGSATGIDLSALLSSSFVGRGAVSLLVLGVGVTLAAGFYPAFVLSRIKAVTTLSAGSVHCGSRALATVLVGVQFFLAAFLLIALAVVYQQNAELKRAEREIAGDSLLVIENTPELTGLQHEILRRELMRLSGVRFATTTESLPWSDNLPGRMMLASSPSTSAVEQSAAVHVVGYDFFSTFDIDLLAGRLFDPVRLDDFAATGPGDIGIQNLVISRSLSEKLGYASAPEIVGKTIYIPTNVTGEAAARPYNIIGVVEEKALSIANRYGSLPKVYLFNPMLRFHVIRISNENVADTLAEIDSLLQQLVPGVALHKRFITEYFNDSYASFARIAQGFTGVAVIAWVISTIGLYAMAILISRRRIREIAIRRTLGASRTQIVLMLLKSFSKPVFIANLLAWPFAYYAAKAYLGVFNDPIPLTFSPFGIALGVSLLITWISVGGQAWFAANAAPQQVMRYE